MKILKRTNKIYNSISIILKYRWHFEQSDLFGGEDISVFETSERPGLTVMGSWLAALLWAKAADHSDLRHTFTSIAFMARSRPIIQPINETLVYELQKTPTGLQDKTKQSHDK